MFFVSGLLLLIATGTAGRSCEDTWLRYGLSCYMFVGQRVSWPNANNACRNVGGHLVAIQSTEEDAFIRGYLNEHSALGAHLTTWLGGKKSEKENVWQWSVNGDNFTFTNWYPGQPGGPISGGCLALHKHDHTHGYTWGDTHCSGHHSYMCEKEFPKYTFLG